MQVIASCSHDTGEAVAAVPGFTRGLDFAGNLAFVGLSQVRESAVFSGIPISERLAPEERTCGVCVVDLRRGGVSDCGAASACSARATVRSLSCANCSKKW